MKLWQLTPTGHGHRRGGPWDPWYDLCFDMVVRAESEDDARAIAQRTEGQSDRGEWLDPAESNCVELTVDGEPGVIIADTHET